ncbi:MAG: hypothetical protein ACJ71K_02330 [Nitrososphaeraceae archaeon]
MMLSSENENHDKKEEEPKAIKDAEEIKKQRESEQLNVDPEQIIEEEEKRQPHSVEDE